MNRTDNEADEALASIRQTTAAPIRRFIDSVAAARLEDTAPRNGRARRLAENRLSQSIGGLGRMIDGLIGAREAVSKPELLARVVRRLRRAR